MRIGINALAVSRQRPGGDVSYVIELVRRLPALDRDTEWRVFATPEAAQLIGELHPGARYVRCNLPGKSIVARVLWEQAALARVAERSRLDVLHAPINVSPVAFRGKTVLTLHEAEPFMPGSRIPLPLLAWWRIMRSISARRAARILTVSDAARQELARWMGVDAGRVQVVHLGVDLERFSTAAKMSSKPLNGVPYVLWVGRPYPRKNVGTLLSAFAELLRAGRAERLVLIGPPGWDEAALLKRIESEFEPGAVIRHPSVWAELPNWYAHAAVFAFPSTQETFGLPVLEAMACGAPVVAADIPALREVGGDAAMYASPTRPDELAAAISRLLDSDTESRRQQEKGLERAAKFDWSVTAAKTLVQLHAVAAGR